MSETTQRVRDAMRRVRAYLAGGKSLDEVYAGTHVDELGVYLADREILVRWAVDRGMRDRAAERLAIAVARLIEIGDLEGLPQERVEAARRAVVDEVISQLWEGCP